MNLETAIRESLCNAGAEEVEEAPRDFLTMLGLTSHSAIMMIQSFQCDPRFKIGGSVSNFVCLVQRSLKHRCCAEAAARGLCFAPFRERTCAPPCPGGYARFLERRLLLSKRIRKSAKRRIQRR